VPPLAEQERIVKLLDEADALRKLRAQADRRTAALIPALFHQMFGNTLANDKGWEMSELENLSLNITDGKHGDCRPAPNSGYYFVSVKDIVDGRIDYSKAREIMYEDFVEVHKRTKLEEGDVLITNSGTIGRMAVIDSDEKVANTTFQKSVAIIKPTKDCIDPNFLRFALDTCVKHLTSASSGSAQKNLLLGQLRRFKICVPPLALQKEFAGRVTAIRALAAAQAASRQRLDNLFQSLLHQAFNGEL
jgi:type I restriction enzyme S subunit